MPFNRYLPSSLKFRLSTLVVLLVLAATVTVTVVALLLAERDMKAVIGNQQYALLSGAAAHIDEHLAGKLSMLAALAESVPEAAHRDRRLLHQFLAERPTSREAFNSIEVYGADGALLDTFDTDMPLQPFNARGQPYFDRTVASRHGVISAPFFSHIVGAPTVLVTAPVYDSNGKLALVLAGGLNLLRYAPFQSLSALKPGSTGFTFIMTAQGVLLSHPTKARILQNINARPGRNRATEMALAGYEGWTEAENKDGVRGIYSYKRLHQTDWIAAARFPSDEALAPLRQMRYEAAGAATLFAVLAGLLSWVGIERLLQPLEHLRRNITRIKHSRAGIQVLQLDRQDEIGELSGAFYRLMAEREVAQQRTRDSETLIRNILERAPDAFVSCNSQGTVTEWNAKAESTFGWTREEAIGADIAQLLVPERLRQHHTAGMRAFAATGSGPIVNNRVRVPALRRDGSEVPVELSVGVVRDGDSYMATAFLHDVSARIAYEEQIAASEKRARIIADNLPVLIAYLDHDGRYQFTNSHYQRQWGIDPQSMLGKRVDEIPIGTAEPWRGELARALNGERIHYEREMAHGGRILHFMVDLVPDVAPDGTVAGTYLMAADITARKTSELLQAASEKRAAAASRAKSEFVANMSHEIRTPMNAVLGVAYLLGNTELSSVQKKYLDMILASGKALLGILNDVLDFSKIEAGRMELSPMPFQLNDVLNAIATVMTLNAGEKNIELAIGVDPDVPPSLLGDAMRLQQILINLVANAVKFTEQGEVSLLVELAARDGDSASLRFVVCDTGIGMDAAQQSRLFSAFSQADASTTRRFGGTGLGLAICRRLAELMGGAIAVDSKVGCGSRFAVTVPLQLAPEQAAPVATIGPLKLLVVDDNDTSRDYLCKTIHAWKWDADSARSGPEAVALLRQSLDGGARYDAVLVDWQMPDMDGLATMQALRAACPDGPLPVVIMVSAFGRDKLMADRQAQDASAVLIKPVTASSLFDTLHEAMAHLGGEATLASAPATSAQRLAGLRLLLVEDHPLNQIVARGMLEFAGAQVSVADNGQVALDMLRAQPDGYDAVLMDVQMPVMDGFEATRAIRSELRLDVPVLAMTAGVMQAEQEECIRAGMNDFIAKPIDVEQMFSVILRQLPAARAGLLGAPIGAGQGA
jgi:PAS domain S-box-containing protein